MKAITYKTNVSDIGLIDRIGYPTSTPGLLVSEAYVPCNEGEATEWMVIHARSGAVFPFCWDSPEAALACAEKAASIGDWRQDFEATRRLTMGATRVLSDHAYSLGGRLHQARHPGGTPIDNGVIA